MKLPAKVYLLSALLTAATMDSVDSCSKTNAVKLRDELRQSSCRLNANRTAGDEFRASVRAKHGLPDGELFKLSFY